MRTVLLYADDFGRRVSTLVAEPAGSDADTLLVAVRNGRSDAASRHVAERARAAGARWMPATLDRDEIRVGPVFTPGLAPCLECLCGRLDERLPGGAAAPPDDAAAPPDDAEAEVGHLPSQARITAALIRLLVGRARAGTDCHDAVASYGLTSHRLDLSRLVPHWACDRCARLV